MDRTYNGGTVYLIIVRTMQRVSHKNPANGECGVGIFKILNIRKMKEFYFLETEVFHRFFVCEACIPLK
jgi:hypothetical protein